jgi:hypothetical protein
MLLKKLKNMKFKIAQPLILALLSVPVANANDFIILEGEFFMATVTGAPIALTPGKTSSDVNQYATNANADLALNDGTYNQDNLEQDSLYQSTLREDKYQGTSNDDTNTVLFTPFLFFGSPVGTYTASTGIDNPNPTHVLPSLNFTTNTADMSSFYAYWNGTEFNQGASDASIVDNFDNTYTVTWTSLIAGGPFGGKTGSWIMKGICIGCPPSEAGPAQDIFIAQGGLNTHTVTQGDGLVTVSSSLGTTPVNTFSFSWNNTDDVIDGGNGNTSPTFTFDPGTVTPGTYIITLQISDTSVDPKQQSVTNAVINVVASGTLSEITDTDNDGISNSADTIDNTTSATRQQGKEGASSNFELETDSGSLVIGPIASCSGQSSTEVTLNQLKNTSNPSCGATANAADDINAVETGVGGYFNFEVRGITQDAQAQIVIPLHSALPTNAGIRKFSNKTSPAWKPFDSTTTDSVASTAGSSGTCPAPGSSSWSSGLTKGHNCIRLSITDNGTNDDSGFSDGVVRFAGTVAGYEGIGTDLVSGCSMSNNSQSLKDHAEWPLLLMLLGWLGFYAKRNRA